MNTRTATVFRDSSKYPIRFDVLHPGSLFRIEQERSRGLWKATDKRIYRKSRDGFYAEEEGTGIGCCLMPNDMVMPLVQERQR